MFLSILLLCLSLSFAHSADWVEQRPMLAPRSDFVVLASKNIFYVNGGCLSNQTVDGICDEITKTFISYNTLSNEWTRLPNAPTNRTQYSAASVDLGDDTLLFYFGGYDDDDQPALSVDVFSVLNQRWDIYPPMNESMWRSNSAAFVIDGVIYVAGGYDATYTSSNNVLMMNVSASSRDFVVHPSRKNTATGDSGAVTINGKGYVFGGFSSQIGFCTPLSNLEEFNPSTNQWVNKAGLRTPRGDAAYAAVAGLIFIMGGEGKVQNCNESNPISVPTDDVEYYNPSTNQWTFLSDIPRSRFRSSGNVGGANNQSIYIIGGQASEAVNSTIPNQAGYFPALDLVESMDVSQIVQSANDASTHQSIVMSMCITLVALMMMA